MKLSAKRFINSLRGYDYQLATAQETMPQFIEQHRVGWKSRGNGMQSESAFLGALVDLEKFERIEPSQVIKGMTLGDGTEVTYANGVKIILKTPTEKNVHQVAKLDRNSIHQVVTQPAYEALAFVIAELTDINVILPARMLSSGEGIQPWVAAKAITLSEAIRDPQNFLQLSDARLLDIALSNSDRKNGYSLLQDATTMEIRAIDFDLSDPVFPVKEAIAKQLWMEIQTPDGSWKNLPLLMKQSTYNKIMKINFEQLLVKARARGIQLPEQKIWAAVASLQEAARSLQELNAELNEGLPDDQQFSLFLP